MNAAVIRFPGSNCDQDCYRVLRDIFNVPTEYVWHKEASVEQFDLIVLPGGFSYGDYLRCGAIARFSPVMRSVVAEAARGKLILGICNGFQILCEARLLPGALIRNQSLHFICEHRVIRVDHIASPFTCAALTGALLNIPIAHGEGNYVADEATLHELSLNRQILLRYADANGAATQQGNPNGSVQNIAGICNQTRNVFGMMPHPERACDARLGSEDGRVIFESILQSLGVKKAA
jgi:phosphoribosylformylglycinamidine synthase subunit PurQ / glutaminase